MPDPPFQPLTLSVEEWQRALDGKRIRVDADNVSVLADEVEAQAQAAAYLRQRLEDETKRADDNARCYDELKARLDSATTGLAAGVELIASLEAQLAQAQQERDDANQQLEVLRPGGLYAWKTKYEQAEAALEEIQKHVDGFDADAWENSIAELKRLAELQRRRSPTGQEK